MPNEVSHSVSSLFQDVGHLYTASMLRREGFRAIADQTLEDIIRNPPPPERAKNYDIVATSGSTGIPLIIAAEQPDKKFVRYTGVSAPLILYGSASSSLRNARFARNAAQPTHSLVLAHEDLNNNLSALIKEHAPDSMFGFTSFILRVASYMDVPDRSHIARLNLGGEYLTKTIEDRKSVV